MMRLFFHWFMLLALPMFAAAPVVVDAPADGGNDAAADSTPSVEDGAQDSQAGAAGSDNQADSADSKQSLPANVDAKPSTEVKVDGRQLPQSVRNMMQELQKADPKAHGFLKDVLHRDRAWTTEFPGGLTEATKLKSDMAAITQEFPDMAELRTNVAEWKGSDDAYNRADPKVVDTWAQMNPASFAKLMPTAINKFAATNPEGYQSYMAGVIERTMQNAGITQTLGFISRLLAKGDTEGANAELQGVSEWLKGLGELSKKKVEPAQPQVDQRGTELDQREAKLFESEVAGELNPARQAMIRKEAKNLLPKGVELDDETFEAIDAQVQRNADKIIMADPNFIKKFGAYMEAKDKAGLVAFMKQRLNDVLPSANGKQGAVEKAVKLFFRGAPTPRPTPKPAATPGKPAAQPQGWVKLAAGPAPHDIDHVKSSFEMKMQKQAILKDGRKVFWGDRIPA